MNQLELNECYALCRLEGEAIKQLCRAHYESSFNPPRKAFDVYTAVALVKFMVHTENSADGGSQYLPGVPKKLFYSSLYGITLVSERNKWDDALESYISKIDTQVL